METGRMRQPGPIVEIPQERESESASSYRGNGNRRNGAISSSTSAYNDINATLGSFYETPREDPEKGGIESRGGAVEAGCRGTATRTDDLRGAGSIAGKIFYELAAKYTPGKDGAGTEKREETEPAANGRKAKPFPWDRSPHRWCHRFRNPSVIPYCWHGMAQTGYAGSIRRGERRLTGIRGVPSVPACMVTRP